MDEQFFPARLLFDEHADLDPFFSGRPKWSDVWRCFFRPSIKAHFIDMLPKYCWGLPNLRESRRANEPLRAWACFQPPPQCR
jgi:hypothetical protein